MDRRLFGLALVTVLLYAPTVGYGYVYEDWNDLETFTRPWPLVEEPLVNRLKHPIRILRDASFAVSGTEPRQAHLGNVVLHLVNGLLVYAVAVPWMGGAAVFAAGLFWLHPVQVESVAYISARPDLLAVTFTLLMALAWRRWWVSLLCAVCAVLSKETFAMVLLFPLIVGSWDRANRVLWAIWAAVCAPMVLYGVQAFGRAPDLLGAIETFGQLSRLLLLWVWPTNQSIDHDWTLLTPPVLLLVLCAWIVAIGVAWLREWPVWSAALGLVLVFFLPRFVIPLSEGLHEHHLYAPSVVLSLAAAWGLRKETETCAAI